jgi:hypothetical protein
MQKAESENLPDSRSGIFEGTKKLTEKLHQEIESWK